jgi:LCP family protein required for cell wall assembly
VIPRTRRGTLWRFFFAAVIVVGATAATTAVAGLLQFKDLANALSVTPGLASKQIVLPDPGQPQTILIIGSDHRAGESFTTANTDTMLLVRLDANSHTINMLSIPRDLQVQIPGYGTAKINAAYADGGPNLLIKTIRANVFPDLKVNHIVDVNFGGFSALVNAIGCVYSDVDHRYYNNTAVTGYSSINIQPGYQRLCGFHALQFVRFRHTDSDLVRNARQQDFIRWAKDQYGVTNLFNNRDELLRIFGEHAQTDRSLHTTDQLINLFDLVLNAAGHTIKQVKFPAIQVPGCGTTGANGVAVPCYLTADPSAEAGVFRAFMRPTLAAPPAKSAKANTGGSRKRSGRIQTAGLTADTADGRTEVAQLAKVKMPVYFPRLVKTGTYYCLGLIANCPVSIASPDSYPRGYAIKDQQGRLHAAYRMTLELNPLLGEYYGVQGTTWTHPPLLSAPTETRSVAGKRLQLFASAGRITNVAWRTPTGVYWISNTLTNDISNQQMVAMAASLTRG